MAVTSARQMEEARCRFGNGKRHVMSHAFGADAARGWNRCSDDDDGRHHEV